MRFIVLNDSTYDFFHPVSWPNTRPSNEDMVATSVGLLFLLICMLKAISPATQWQKGGKNMPVISSDTLRRVAMAFKPDGKALPDPFLVTERKYYLFSVFIYSQCNLIALRTSYLAVKPALSSGFSQ